MRYECVIFDAYGTLFDVHSVVASCDALFAGRGRELSQLWRSKQLEYTWLRSLMGRYQDFDAITRDALKYACRALSLPLDETKTATLMEKYHRLAPYPDVAATLPRLGDRRLAIFSNGAPAMLDTMVRHAGLDKTLDAVLSVDSKKIYKPHPSVYQYAVDELAVRKEAVAFISSNFWDVCGATSFGFRAFWINRAGNQPDELGFTPERVLSRLDDLVDALDA